MLLPVILLLMENKKKKHVNLSSSAMCSRNQSNGDVYDKFPKSRSKNSQDNKTMSHTNSSSKIKSKVSSSSAMCFRNQSNGNLYEKFPKSRSKNSLDNKTMSHTNSSSKIKSKVSSPSVRVHHNDSNRIVKNSEKHSKNKAVLNSGKHLKPLIKESNKLTDNPLFSLRCSSKSSQDGKKTSLAKLLRKGSTVGHTKSSSDKSAAKKPNNLKPFTGRSKACIKAKQFVEQNEKRYPRLKAANAEHGGSQASIDYIKTHFNSTQWSLENHLSDLVQQSSDLKLELKAFNSWYKDINGVRSRSGRKSTFHAFDKYYQKLQTQGQKIRAGDSSDAGNVNGTTNGFRPNGTPIERRLYYQDKLKVKNHINLFPVASASSSLVNGTVNHKKHSDAKGGRVAIKVEPSDGECSEDDSTNWELVSLEHAFNAFPDTYHTTKPKVKSLKIENDDAGSDESDKPLARPKTTKKSSKKMRKTKNNRRQAAASKQLSAFTSQSEPMMLFSPEIWQKFESFLTRVAFAIDRRNYEPLQCYLKSMVRMPHFLEQMRRERRLVLASMKRIQYQAPVSETVSSNDETENLPTLPAKRLRRSSYKTMVDYDCLVSAAARTNRANTRQSSTRSSSKSPSPGDTTGGKRPLLPGTFHSNLQTDMPLMTRTQKRYFFENVIKNENNGQQPSSNAATTFKDRNDVKNHMLKLVMSMKSVQDLSVDIKNRQPILHMLKVFKEFLDFKFRPPKNNGTPASSPAVTAGLNRHRNRFFNSRRRRKRSVRSSHKSSKGKTGDDVDLLDVNHVNLTNHCHGVECSIKFDMPTYDRLMLLHQASCDSEETKEEESVSETGYGDPDDYDKNSVQYCHQTLEFINQTEAMYKAPKSFFGPLKMQKSGSEARPSSSGSGMPSPSFCKSQISRNKTVTKPSSGSGSRCEMKLRSRTCTSSSSLSSPSADYDEYPLFSVDNSKIFDKYVDIGVEEDLQLDVETCAKKKRSRGKRSSGADATKIQDEHDQQDPAAAQTVFWDTMIDSMVEPMSKLVWSMNQSKLKQLRDMTKRDHKQEQAEARLQKLDFEIIDLYHQYLHKEKKFSDQELTECLEKLERHAVLTEEWQRKTLQVLAMAPNSQQMCWAFSERSTLMAVMERTEPKRSISRDRFEAVLGAVRHQMPPKEYLELTRMAQDIDWIRLDQPIDTMINNTNIAINGNKNTTAKRDSS